MKHFGPQLSGHPSLPVVSFSDSCGTLCWSDLSSSFHICLSAGKQRNDPALHENGHI